MCIRDRDHGQRLGQRAQHGVVAAARTPDRLVVGLVGGGAPVSYTHLRAHETVLDLVCRLLLAKKKNSEPTRPHTNSNDHVCIKQTTTQNTISDN